MRCSNCNSPVQTGAQFCGSCGHKITKGEHPKPDNGDNMPSKGAGGGIMLTMIAVLAALGLVYSVSLEDQQQPKKPKIAYESISDAQTTTVPATPQKAHVEEISVVIDGQLKALKEKDLDRAYNDFVSKKFKEATSLEQFKDFIKSYPILTDYKSYSIMDTNADENNDFALVLLVKDNDATNYLEYTFELENNQWKVQGFRLDPTGDEIEKSASSQTIQTEPSAQLANNPEVSEIIAATDGQLKALRSQNLTKAYFTYTSKDYQKAKTLQQFAQHIRLNPILGNHTNVVYDYSKLVIEDNQAKILAILKKGDQTVNMSYSLVKEGGEWKIKDSFVQDSVQTAQTPTDTTTPASELRGDVLEDKKNVLKVVDSFMSLLRSKNIDNAYSDYTSPEFQKATSLTAFKEFVKNYSIIVDNKSISYSDVTFENEKANLTAVLLADKISNPVEFTLIKANNEWKIFGLRILVPDEVLSSADKGEAQAVIADQLSALRSNDLEKAYSFTSKEFREATSLENFKAFIKMYPIFTENKSASYSDARQDHQTVAFTVTLGGAKNTGEVEYRLAKSGNKWEVWSIDLLQNTVATERPSSFKSSEILKTIEDQLEAVRKKDITQAYSYSSKAFKEATSYENFEQFVRKNPVFAKNKSASLTQLTFENDIGIYEGNLTSTDDETEPVKYRLIYEDNAWKILSINILYSLQQPTSTDLEFSKVVIGTEVDLKGLVTNPNVQLKTDSNKITANIYVNNGKKGDTVEVVLEHVESASKVAPVSAQLEKDGDSIVSFIFSPPSQGWPKGNYKINTSSSTGVKNTFNFAID